MKKKNPFQEFIESLPQLNGLKGDPVAKAVDEALAAWIHLHNLKGFEVDHKRRNLTINMIKKANEIDVLIQKSPFKTYLYAAILMKCNQIFHKYELKKKNGAKIGEYALLLEFAREIFSSGYALKSLENQEKEKKNNDN